MKPIHYFLLFLSALAPVFIAVQRIVRRAYTEAYQHNSAEYHLPFMLVLRVEVSRREATFEATEFVTQLDFCW